MIDAGDIPRDGDDLFGLRWPAPEGRSTGFRWAGPVEYEIETAFLPGNKSWKALPSEMQADQDQTDPLLRDFATVLKELGYGAKGPWLIDAPGPRRYYRPLTVPYLHHEFAKVRPSEAAILDFAQQYGRLGYDTVPLRPAGKSVLGLNELVDGEQLGTWMDEIAAMRQLLEVWDLLKHERYGKLKDFFEWRHDRGRRQVWWVQHVGPDRIVNRRLADERGPNAEVLSAWARGSEGSVAEPARHYLRLEIARRLRGQASPALLLGSRSTTVSIVPHNLLACMYVTFSYEIAGHTAGGLPRFRQCRSCGKLFIPPRRDNVYCEPKCKSKWHYDQVGSKMRRSKEHGQATSPRRRHDLPAK